MIALWAEMFGVLFVVMLGIHLFWVRRYRKIVELQAAKIRFLLLKIASNPDSRDITIEFMDRSFNGQNFKEF